MFYYTWQHFLMKILLFASFINVYSNSKDCCMVLSPRPNAGLFSVFNTVIGCLYTYELQNWSGLKVDFKDQGLYYDKNHGSNWWEYYFEPIRLGAVNNATLKEFSADVLLDFTLLAQFTLDKFTVFKLIKKYIKLKDHIKNKIDTFYHKHFKGSCVIGVHYRGTDKVSEAPHVPYEKVFCELQYIVQNCKNSNIKIFVATDDALFFEYIKDKFPDKVFGIEAIRSNNNKPVHFFEKTQNYKKGEDAVIDCILLSRCQLLVRTASCLSDYSIRFNPDIAVVNLNKGHILMRKK